MRIPTFSAPDTLRGQLTAMVDTLLADLTEGASPQEMASWSTKAAAARAILKGEAGEAQAVMIRTEAAIRGRDTDEYAEKIATKADSFESLISTIMGLRGKFVDAIAVAKPDDLDVIFAQIDAAFTAVRRAAGK